MRGSETKERERERQRETEIERDRERLFRTLAEGIWHEETFIFISPLI